KALRADYTMSKNVCLQGHFCEAVNRELCGTAHRAKPKDLPCKALRADYTTRKGDSGKNRSLF
ncbi:MAG: hypothetical protein IKD31_00865, partial [Clostridia bacterium]|nr:hypothetical protein [Clostridia bacterium]